MPLSQSAAIELFRETLLPRHVNESARVAALDLWVRGNGEDLTLPRKASREHRGLAELAKTPLLSLVVTTTAQGLFADGYKSPDSAEDAAGWRTWQANDLDSRQSAIYRGALGHGLAYATVMPGVDATGPRSVIRGVSARKMVALYQDPAEDDWPMFALRKESGGLWRLYDEEAVYFIATESDNKTTYDRLLTQHYNSWKVRTIAGLQEFAADEATAERKKVKLAQDDILVAEDADTKFGTLDETPLEGFIKAGESDLETISSVAQMPSTIFKSASNISADAIAELRAGLGQKLFERQMSFGKSDVQALRLAHLMETGEEGDVSARMTWRDMQPRTIAQVVDALGKAVTMLEVPPQAVWHLIPGVSKTDVDDWKAEAQTAQARAARQGIAQAAAAARANGTVAGLNGAVSNAG